MSISDFIPEPVRKPLRLLRYLPDRVLHPTRRRRTLAQFRERNVKSAVFICLGNINRSAYAEAVFSRAVPADRRHDVVVRSAGFIGPDRPASEPAQALARRRGLDLSRHRSRLIDAGELAASDLIVVMDARQCRDVCRMTGKSQRDIVVLGDLDPRAIEKRTIQDPYGHPDEVFERVFDRIDRCMDQLAAAVWKR